MQEAVHDGVTELVLQTNVGNITTRYYSAEGTDAVVLWVGGAGGGLDGPAGGLYPRLAGQLTGQGIASLRLHYRNLNDLEHCVIDALVGVECLWHSLDEYRGQVDADLVAWLTEQLKA